MYLFSQFGTQDLMINIETLQTNENTITTRSIYTFYNIWAKIVQVFVTVSLNVDFKVHFVGHTYIICVDSKSYCITICYVIFFCCYIECPLPVISVTNKPYSLIIPRIAKNCLVLRIYYMLIYHDVLCK